MKESWEEKTERLEREYEARIGKLREELLTAQNIAGIVAANVREIGEGAMATLKSENAELTKRVAELDGQNTNKRVVPDLCNNLLLSLKVPRLEAENAALNKRVAELELEVAVLTDNLNLSRRVSDNLKSQLAWTPVSAGLPSEPGLYLFDNISEISLYRLTDTGSFLKHTDNDTERWETAQMHYWTNYRRIELPKDGET